eukprot:GHVL01020819.1.p1 GENE.GHVL01020819.1~~GHVL01020819.1.p1  ORF type:complete len:315 (+),score=38.23 GHVL01020819.1:164-1108(+)
MENDPFVSASRYEGQEDLSHGAIYETPDQGTRKSSTTRDKTEAIATAFLPVIVFLLIQMLFLFCYFTVYPLVWFLILLLILFSIYVMIISRDIGIKSIGLLILLSILISSFIGLWVWTDFTSTYLKLSQGGSYTNVLPTEPSERFSDAAKLVFNNSARIDSARAVGYRAGKMYCAAPIMDSTDMTKVQFWAVGMDCCDESGSFNCDSAADANSYSGVVITSSMLHNRSFLDDSTNYDLYRKTIQKSEASNDLLSSSHPTLVRWVKNPDAFITSFWTWGLGICLICAAVYMIISILITGFLRMFVKKAREEHIGF